MGRSLPSLDLLRGFEAAARHLSFTRAAAELFVTQSAVSRQIKTLEERLGVLLFRRGNRELFLTEEGQRLYKSVREALQHIEQTVASLQRREAAPVTVTASVSFASLWLVPRLQEFRRACPHVDVRIAADNRVLDLERSRIDLAIRYGRIDDMPAEGELLFGETIFPVCSPALLREPSRPLREPADLARHTLLQLDNLAADWPWLSWTEWLESMGLGHLKPAGVLRFSHYDHLIQAALAGEGIALGRDPLIRQSLQEGRLVAPFVSRKASPRGYYLLRSRLANPEQIETFVSWLKTAARSGDE